MAERVRFRGGLTCSCVVASLPLVEKDLQRLGLLKGPLQIFQLGYRGDVGASAGTHDRGGCVDIQMLGPAGIDITRLWGWTFQPRRLRGVVEHCHGWPYKCEHLSSAARQQEADWDRRDAGLVGPGKVQGRWPIKPWNVALRERRHLVESTGVPIMADAEPIRISYTDPQPLTAGDVGYVLLNDQNHTTVTGASEGVEVVAGVGIEGLAEGEYVDLSWRIDWKKSGAPDQAGKETNVGVTIQRPPGMPDRRYSGQVMYAERVPKASVGWTACLRLVYATNAAAAKIARLQINGWKL